jgi:hypothetical protein
MTAQRKTATAMRWAVVVATALAAAAAEAAALAAVLKSSGTTWPGALAGMPVPLAGALAAPVLAAVLGALAMRRAARASAPVAAPVVGREAPAPGTGALQLLGLLQQEGRFVDFLEEDLAPYSDEQIGAAVRSIHEGCRSALRERVELKPILAGSEGAAVTVERGFDPAAVRVTGNVHGEPPYRGVLRHPGWRSDGIRLPEQTGDHDASILAPAEVEVL